MVYGVIEEEHLGGLDEDGEQWHQAVLHENLDTCLQHGEDAEHEGAYDQIRHDREHEAADAEREVVDEHLEACRRVPFDQLVELLDQPAGGGSDEHRGHEHRRDRRLARHGIDRDARDDGAHDGDGGDDAPALTRDQVAAL